MKFQECQHVFSNGVTCRSPRLRDHRFCYYHVAVRDRIRRQRIAAEKKLPLQFPVLEDAHTIQFALTDVVNAMFCDRIDTRKAALALYALQTASANLNSEQFPSGDRYCDYSPELDASLPELPPPHADVAANAAVQGIEKVAAPNAGDTLSAVPSTPQAAEKSRVKIPPKKPVASAKQSVISELRKKLNQAQRRELAAIRKYTRAFQSGTASPLRWVIERDEAAEEEDQESDSRRSG